MKTLDNVLKPLGERISSPLYSTFLISWCVSNWKIFYVTFIIPADHLPSSKLDYINSYLIDYWHMWVYPGSFTIAFIFLFPFIEKKVLKTWYRNKADRKKIIVERMEQSPVSGEEHRNLLLKYVQRESELTHFFNKEGEWLKEKEDIQTLYNDSLKKSNEDAKRLTELGKTIAKYETRMHLTKVFDGRWKFSYNRQKGALTDFGEEYFYIDSQSNYIVEGKSGAPKYRIAYFFYDQLENTVYLLKEHVSDDKPEFFFNSLRRVDSVTYEGREFGIKKNLDTSMPVYQAYEVTYRKSGHEKPPEDPNKKRIAEAATIK